MEPSPPPRVLVIGGPNGAGKSTLAERVFGNDLRMRTFVNADTIARGLSRFEPEKAALEAGRVMLRWLNELREQRADFAFETTLAGRGHARFLKSLRDEGYWVDLIYVALRSAEQSAARVAKRVAEGGHNIDRSDIHRRFTRTSANLFNLYIPLADRWMIYDNSQATPRLVARGGMGRPALIREVEVYDELRAQAQS